MSPRVTLAALVGLAAAVSAGPAAALSCTASFSPVAFGTVDLLPGGAATAVGSVHVACTAIGIAGVSVCPYLGAGSGGQDAGARYLQGPGATLPYQLYSDAGYTEVWGDPGGPYGGGAPLLSASGNLAGTASAAWDVTIYARIASGTAPVPEGAYTSTFSAADVDFQYGASLLILDCTTLSGLLNQTITPSNALAVSATVERDCDLTVEPLDFGSRGLLDTETTSSADLTVRCTPDTAYTIALGDGQNPTGPMARRMRLAATSNYVAYGLYKDAAASQPWGETGGNRVSGTGSGADQTTTVHGVVPAQAATAAGVYSDVVVVTVAY